MTSKYRKHYLFASDFDQTLTFNDTGYVLSELLGISVEEFERKAKGMAKLNLVQQGAELSYLLLHDPVFRTRVRRDDLIETGKRIRLKENIKQVYEILDRKIDGFHFDFELQGPLRRTRRCEDHLAECHGTVRFRDGCFLGDCREGFP
jgi:aminoglycoside phosphotransferase family enzyme